MGCGILKVLLLLLFCKLHFFSFCKLSLVQPESLFNLIPVSEHDANQLACNAVVINNTVIFPSEDIEAIKTVEELGLNAEVANVSEPANFRSVMSTPSSTPR